VAVAVVIMDAGLELAVASSALVMVCVLKLHAKSTSLRLAATPDNVVRIASSAGKSGGKMLWAFHSVSRPRIRARSVGLVGSKGVAVAG
jgi:hypothetical protein